MTTSPVSITITDTPIRANGCHTCGAPAARLVRSGLLVCLGSGVAPELCCYGNHDKEDEP